jgi:hypothetical protein
VCPVCISWIVTAGLGVWWRSAAVSVSKSVVVSWRESHCESYCFRKTSGGGENLFSGNKILSKPLFRFDDTEL